MTSQRMFVSDETHLVPGASADTPVIRVIDAGPQNTCRLKVRESGSVRYPVYIIQILVSIAGRVCDLSLCSRAR